MVSFPRHELYFITGRYKESNLSTQEVAEAYLGGGAKLIQWRDKGASYAEVKKQVRQLLPQMRAAGAHLIINDYPALAAELGADGVHIGQDDEEPCRAREILGPNRWLGLSTHNLAQVEAASTLHEKEGGTLFDYLALGPIFPTTSKENPDPTVGLELLESVRRIWTGPLVVIGGIGPERFASVAAAGADAPAIISAALAPSRKEVREKVSNLRASWSAARQET